MRGLVDVVGCRRGQEECVYLIESFGFQFRPRNEAYEVQRSTPLSTKWTRKYNSLIEGPLEAKTKALVFAMRS